LQDTGEVLYTILQYFFVIPLQGELYNFHIFIFRKSNEHVYDSQR
jgi:hypothetical protein